MEAPGVDDDATGARIGDEDADLVVVGFGLGERVVQHDVDRVRDVHGGIEFGDDHAVPVPLEHACHAHDHHVVVIDECHGDRALRCRRHRDEFTLPGV